MNQKDRQRLDQLIEAFARDAYARYEAVDEKAWWGSRYTRKSGVHWDGHLRDEIADLLLKDKNVRKLFRKVDKRVMLSSTFGRGQQLTLQGIPSKLLDSAYSELKYINNFKKATFTKKAKDNVSRFLEAVSPSGTKARYVVLFKGLYLPHERSFKVGTATLRKPQSYEALAVQEWFELEGAPFSLMLDGLLKFKIWEYKTDSVEDREGWGGTLDHLGDEVRIVQMSAHLQENSEAMPSRVQQAAIGFFEPIFSKPRFLEGSDGLQSRFGSRRLNDKEADEFGEWVKRFSSPDLRKSKVAVHRLASAINGRNGAEGFVDAVISLDGFLGSNDAEQKLRVGLGAAKLLGGTTQEQSDNQDLVMDWYNIRSKVVHGGKQLGWMEGFDLRNNIVPVALRICRELMTNRADLLKLQGGQRLGELLYPGKYSKKK